MHMSHTYLFSPQIRRRAGSSNALEAAVQSALNLRQANAATLRAPEQDEGRMSINGASRLIIAAAVCAALTACGGGPARGPSPDRDMRADARATSIWDVLGNNENPNTTVGVNKYLWNASLEVLNFLPVQTIDPFTGVIVTGYGTPPGGGRSYRATVKVADPALDARSLKLSLQGPGGAAVAPGTVRAVEDAILTRARQLRQQDGRL